MLTTYTAVVVPLVASFRITSRSMVWLTIDSMVDIFFFTDVVVNFRTSYVDGNGAMVTDLKKIRINYARTWFPIDILSCLPYDALTIVIGEIRQQEFSYFLSVLKTFRLLRMIRIARDMDRYLEHAYATLVVLVCLILLICHWMACGWYIVTLYSTSAYLQAEQVHFNMTNTESSRVMSVAENQFPNLVGKYGGLDLEHEAFEDDILVKNIESETSQPKNHLPPATWLIRISKDFVPPLILNQTTGSLQGGPVIRRRYILCLYFTMTSVISAGFGNIAGDTFAEQIYCIFILLIGGLLYAAILGNVTNILQQISNKHHDFLDQMKSVRDFAALYELPPKLAERICDYVSYTRVVTHGLDVEAVLGQLPDHKRAEVCVHMHKRLLQKHPVFTSLDENSVRLVARRLERFVIAPGEIVCDKGELVDCVFFIITGTVEVTWEGMLIGLLTNGDSFGVDIWEQLEGRSSHVMVKALTYVDINFITGENMAEVAKTLPSIKTLFRKNLNMTFCVSKMFNLRSIESVQWERDAATDPKVAKKVKRLKKWHQKIMIKKRRMEYSPLEPDHQSIASTSREQTEEKSAWKLLKEKSQRVMKSLRWSLRVCTLIHGYGDLTRGARIEDTSIQKVTRPGCCPRCGKKKAQNSKKLVKIKKSKVSPAKRDFKIKLKPLKTLDRMEEISVEDFENDAQISATCYRLENRVGGKPVLCKVGIIRFSLEGREWEDFDLPGGVKDSLRSFLDFKTSINFELERTDKKLTVIENLMKNIEMLVGDEVNTM
ncbi:voltage-gated delayed rectifier potassium channel KCNH1-like [Ciona intestinalis]